MTVKQLIERLQKFGDDVQVVVPGTDHSYRARFGIGECDAEVFSDGFMVEYYDKGSMNNKKNKVIPVVVIE